MAFGLALPMQAQFSPGKLSKAHAEYEGLDNCTLCHELGAKVSEAKCLECHKELQSLIDLKRGYHASKEVSTKTCINCHSEHHGRKFNSVRFDSVNFNHKLTGYELKSAHERIDCRDCHKSDYIADTELAKRSGTYLGLEEACLTCHVDYHRGDLGEDCLKCHNYQEFEQTPGFDHDKSEFPLRGAHQNVDCKECHPIESREGKEFQKFKGIDFAQCTDCHTDAHNGRFGTKCTDCHSENSWSQLKNTHRFNHNLTKYPLLGQHRTVSCNECHTSGDFSIALPFANCTDCHTDYHEGEIADITSGLKDCDACHTLDQPFTWSNYDWEDHNASEFPLEGAHLATPCFACHKESEEARWDFEFEAHNCVSCHEDIHSGRISESFYPEQDCQACHGADRWSDLSFDHQKTDWPLEGAHSLQVCRDCHYEGEEQHFNDLESSCNSCHDNVHGEQFTTEGAEGPKACTECHRTAFEWNADNFDHQLTQFPLEGKHAEIDCSACHKPEVQQDGSEMVIYKIPQFQCIDCHGS